MGALEVQDFQVGVGGLFFHQVDLPEEIGGYFIDAVRHSLVVGRGLVDVHCQRGQGHASFAVKAFQRTVDGDFALGVEAFFLEDALGNEADDRLQRGSVQAVLQVDVGRALHGVASQGAFQVKFQSVDVQQGVVQGQGPFAAVQFQVGLQAGGYAVHEQFAILPEEDVAVVEIHFQQGVSPLQAGL